MGKWLYDFVLRFKTHQSFRIDAFQGLFNVQGGLSEVKLSLKPHVLDIGFVSGRGSILKVLLFFTNLNMGLGFL